MAIFIILGWLVVATFIVILFYKLTKFILTAYFGKNINITYVDKYGHKQVKSIHADNDDELFSILNEMQSNSKGGRS